ncbi:MAG: RNA polymerase factor sigma-54 [Desulfobulbaceae bacterium]
MALELRQQLKLAQKLVMTPQLRQAIKLLQLNRLELTEALQAEIEENPLLEESGDDAGSFSESDLRQSRENEDLPEPEVTTRVPADDTAGLGEVNWGDYENTFDADFSFAREKPPADAPSQFDFISKKPGLSAHMQWQLADLDLDEHQLDIAMFIIGNLDRHGYLRAEIEDIRAYAGCSAEAAEEVLRLVQGFDPPGIAARNIRECLLLQLERKGLADSLAYRIVDGYMDLLETRNYQLIARNTGSTVRAVSREIEIITGLDPYPGNRFSNEEINYVVPDVYVYKIDDEYVIRLNNEGLPRLKLSDDYLAMIKGKNKLAGEPLAYLREKQRSAEWFIKSLQQRQRTIYKVMESILKFQRDFFEYGPGHLKPLILRDVADDIGMHESTVSRVTSNKYAHTPQGIYELKYFFSTAVSTMDGDTVASESIRNRIRQLIQAEDPTKPLSDNRISELLAGENIQVARRTVAKYRDQMGILPVKFRRKK